MCIEEIKHRFNNTEKLYHYTTFESAIKILQSRTLLFGRLKDMNDINELYRPLAFDFHPNHRNEYNEEVYAKMELDFSKYQQISLTRDWIRNGFDIPAMWGHYANKGNGVCLVFDKKLFLKRIEEDKGQRAIFDEVQYSTNYSPVIVYQIDDNEDIVPFSRNEEKDYFYHKTNDWQYEQEFRVLIKSDSDSREKLEFQDALFAIIMHNAESVGHNKSIFQSVECDILKKIIMEEKDVHILEHSMWFEDTQLTIENQTIWTSNPINDKGFTSKAIELADEELSKTDE